MRWCRIMLTMKISHNICSGSIGAYIGIRVLVHVSRWCTWICWENCLAGHCCVSGRICNNHCHFMLWKCASYVAAQFYRIGDLHNCRRLHCRRQHVARQTRSGKSYLFSFSKRKFQYWWDWFSFFFSCKFVGITSCRTDCNCCHWPHHFCRANEMGLYHDGWHIIRFPHTARCYQYDFFVHIVR